MSPHLQRMVAMTLRKPDGEVIMRGCRDSWQSRWHPCLRLPFWIAIHVVDGHGHHDAREYLQKVQGFRPLAEQPTGIVGMALVDNACKRLVPPEVGARDGIDECHWLWRLGVVVEFETPVPCEGADGLWEVPAAVHPLVKSSLVGGLLDGRQVTRPPEVTS